MPPAASSHGEVETKGFPWKLRRMAGKLTEFFERYTTKPYPQTAEALQRLREAMDKELPVRRNRQAPTYTRLKRKSPMPAPAGPSRKHYQRSLRLQIENDKLRSQVASLTVAKSGGNLISPDWIVRVFLSEPTSNARGLAKAFREVVGLDT
jgi:hypothetical protein